MNKKVLLVLLLPLVMAMPVLADDVSVTTDVLKSIAVTFNYASVAFGALSQGSTNNLQVSTGYNYTVDTNFAYESYVNGTDFTDGGSHTFGIGNLRVDDKDTYGSLAPCSGTTVTGSPSLVRQDSDTGIGLTMYQGYCLDIPAYQYATSYTATITWTVQNQ